MYSQQLKVGDINNEEKSRGVAGEILPSSIKLLLVLSVFMFLPLLSASSGAIAAAVHSLSNTTIENSTNETIFDSSICYPRPVLNGSCEQILCDKANVGNNDFQNMLIEANMRLGNNLSATREQLEYCQSSNSAKMLIIGIFVVILIIFILGRFWDLWR